MGASMLSGPCCNTSRIRQCKRSSSGAQRDSSAGNAGELKGAPSRTCAPGCQPARSRTAATALALSSCAAVDAAGCSQAACMACKPGLAAVSTCAVSTAGTASLSAPTRLDCCSAAHKLALLIASLLGSARWGTRPGCEHRAARR
ncbi:hypothetical protein SDC9_166574 [bioreactor metagenome]|uniref:Uncharacterized protein n=1 Tax=bioreactor metagenome TaxID=1076179 RepID=A0A645FXE8_9ZZZZ